MARKPVASRKDGSPYQDVGVVDTVLEERRLPQPFREVKVRLPQYRFHTIFDIGANVGQSAVTYANTFPNARVFMFEPVAASYARAVQATRQYPNVLPFNIAASDIDGEVPMEAKGTSTGNKVNFTVLKGTSVVPAVRLDSFVQTHGIDRISFLKIDVEGYEMQVLEGGVAALQRTDFVQLELGMSLRNTYHLGFDEGVRFMDANGFVPFLICKQMFERKFPMLNRSDTVFINTNISR